MLDYNTIKKNIIDYGNRKEQNGFNLGIAIGILTGSIITLCVVYLIE